MNLIRTRFAPSPTGLLHLGHAYAAFYAKSLAEAHGGEFLLRFEDIDTTRVREEFYLAIEEDLRWLGMTWHGVALRQVDRLSVYKEALEKLKSLGVLYPCFCTRREIQEEVARITHAPHGPEGALYPGTCKKLTESQREDRLGAGEPHCWRLDTERCAERMGQLQFEDQIHGEIEVNFNLLGDVVLARKDIETSYHLAVVVDDDFQGITDVTRGEDLLPSTHVHRILQELLGFVAPRYSHHHLILDEDGRRLAKRDDALSIQTLREQGKSPAELIDYLQTR